MIPLKENYVSIDFWGKVARGKSKHRPRNAPELYNGKYPFIQTGEIKHANMYISTFSQTYNEKGLAQSKLWEPNTLCITIAANIAETAILKIKACFPDSIIGFISDINKSDIHFVKYCFDSYKLQIQAISQGTTQDNLSLEKLRTIKFKKTPLPIQKKIAAILSAYDELIENNNRRIVILEKMAEEIYKEWFVRMRFPGHEKTKFVKGVPEGWEVKQVGKIMRFEKGKSPIHLYDYKNDDTDTDTDIYLNVNAIEGGNIQYASNVKAIKCNVNETLMLMDGARSSIVFNGNIGIVSSTFAVIRTMPKYRFILHEYFKINKETMVSNNTGSAIPHANKEFIFRMLVKTPMDSSLITCFNNIYKTFFKEKQNVVKSNKLLKKSRDLLLPRLISGKLDVENLDIAFPPGMREMETTKRTTDTLL